MSVSNLDQKMPNKSEQIPWTILKNRGQIVGFGTTGDLYGGEWRGRKVVFKELHLSQLAPELFEEFERDTGVMAQCNSPYIVPLLGICVEPGRYGMVREWMPNGLFNFLRGKSWKVWDNDYLQMAIDVGRGLSYLHSNKIILKNLNIFNVLVDANSCARISSLGLAKIRKETQKTKQNEIRGQAPEVAQGGEYTQASDVFNYGILLWDLVSMRSPIDKFIIDAKLKRFMREGRLEPTSENCPEEYWKTILWCCEKDPQKRPPINSVVEYLETVNFEGKTSDVLFKMGESSEEEQDERKAIDRYRKAGARGHVGSLCNLGVIYQNHKNYEEAFRWFEKAFNHKNALATEKLAQLCERGMGVPRSWNHACIYRTYASNMDPPLSGLNNLDKDEELLQRIADLKKPQVLLTDGQNLLRPLTSIAATLCVLLPDGYSKKELQQYSPHPDHTLAFPYLTFTEQGLSIKLPRELKDREIFFETFKEIVEQPVNILAETKFGRMFTAQVTIPLSDVRSFVEIKLGLKNLTINNQPVSIVDELIHGLLIKECRGTILIDPDTKLPRSLASIAATLCTLIPGGYSKNDLLQNEPNPDYKLDFPFVELSDLGLCIKLPKGLVERKIFFDVFKLFMNVQVLEINEIKFNRQLIAQAIIPLEYVCPFLEKRLGLTTVTVKDKQVPIIDDIIEVLIGKGVSLTEETLRILTRDRP